MRHIPFLKTLAKAKDAADPVWRDAAPGYLVLRFFDRWIEEGPAAMAADPLLPALRARIRNAKSSAPEVRRTLLHALDALEQAVGNDPVPAAAYLFEYAEYLRANGLPQLAGHVYGVVVEALDTFGLTHLSQLATALIHQALNARILGDYEIARTLYTRAETVAQQHGNFEQVGLARIGLGNILKALGNLPHAEELFTAVIADAKSMGVAKIEAYGYHARGGILHLRGQYDNAMRDYYRAAENLMGIDRERVLGDLAVCESDAGYRTAARDTHRLLAYTSQFDSVRAASLVNLIHLAVLDKDEAAFHRARLDLTAHMQRHHLPVEAEAHAVLYTAMGVEQFSSIESAQDAYQVAVTKARQAKIHQVEFEAEQRLADLLEQTRPPVPRSVPPKSVVPPAELRYITDTIAAAALSATMSL
jgi:tetratricopeptide (TPR) repeat protein